MHTQPTQYCYRKGGGKKRGENREKKNSTLRDRGGTTGSWGVNDEHWGMINQDDQKVGDAVCPWEMDESNGITRVNRPIHQFFFKSLTRSKPKNYVDYSRHNKMREVVSRKRSRMG